ncbi:MAG TPA: MFS transporter [Smithella sp.]|jgi:MFS family permease|nr:MFS transporter [Smithella sp.]HOO35225.1 MFS transporter [Smithella sp.]HPC07450.1 MFS transporter [Smithella sp.]HPK22178.1 MFS transporter [Smithella sp.]HPR15081.1 MFS transporter [Smithella sp.]
MKNDRKIFWGWYIVGGAFLVMAMNYGARYCFGVFLKPMANEFALSRSVISLAAAINMMVYSFGSVFVGRMLDRVAPRWITTVGAGVAACGYLLTGFVDTPIGLYISYGVMVGLGSAGMGVVACSSSVSKWFISKRGVAVGIASMGISLGTVMLTPLAGYIATVFSWRSGLMALSFIMLIVGVVVAQTLMRRTHPEAYGLLPDGNTISGMPQAAEATAVCPVSTMILFRDSRFWTLAVCQGLAVMISMAVFVHQVAYATDNGISKMAAASSLAAVSLTGFMGQFFFGWITDRINDPKYASFLGISFMLAGTVILLNVESLLHLYVAALVYGFGYGSLAPMLPLIIADRFGRQCMGSIYGLLTFFIGTGGAIGPVLGGFIYDHFGSYHNLWLMNIVVLSLIAMAFLTLKKGRPYAA